MAELQFLILLYVWRKGWRWKLQNSSLFKHHLSFHICIVIGQEAICVIIRWWSGTTQYSNSCSTLTAHAPSLSEVGCWLLKQRMKLVNNGSKVNQNNICFSEVGCWLLEQRMKFVNNGPKVTQNNNVFFHLYFTRCKLCFLQSNNMSLCHGTIVYFNVIRCKIYYV